MTPAAFVRTLRRRSLHRSRSAAVIVALVLVALIAAYIGTECVLAALGVRPLLLSPATAVAEWSQQPSIAIGVAVVLGVVGIMMLVSALTLGRRSRHVLGDERSVIVVDDDVLAGAFSGRVARRFGVSGGQARTELARRAALVTVTPTSGRPLDSDAVRASAADYADELGIVPPPTVRARVSSSGVIGA